MKSIRMQKNDISTLNNRNNTSDKRQPCAKYYAISTIVHSYLSSMIDLSTNLIEEMLDTSY
jgi:hypothetical protein